MAIKFTNGIDLLKQAIQNVKLHPVGSDPTSPEDGQVWYRTDTDTFKGRSNGTSKTFSFDEDLNSPVSETLWDAHTIVKADTDDTPAALTVAEQTLVGRITAGNITALTPAEVRTLLSLVIGTDVQAYNSVLANTTASFLTADETKLDGIEALADVTDATNVNAAGAVMESDYDANTVLAATADNTPATLIIPEQTLVGRITAGNIDALSASEVRTLVNVEDNADVTDATNVAAAGAVMDSDISAGEGYLRKTGAGAYEAVKTNLGASTSPGSTDDSNAGYAVGSIWIDTTADEAYVCLDATVSGAVWGNITPDPGAGSTNLSIASRGATTLDIASDTGGDATVPAATTSLTGLLTGADKTKLDNIETAADVTDATNVNAAGAVMESDSTTASMSFVIDEDTMVSDLSTKVPTQQSVKAYVDNALTSTLDYMGGYNASTNTPDLDTSPSGVNKGDVYTVTAAGTFFTVTVEVGDMLIAEVDDASAEADWTIVNRNLDNSTGLASKYTSLIGNGAATSIQVTHNLGSTAVTYSVQEESSGDMVIPDATVDNSNAMTFDFATAPTSNQYRVTVIG